ncbi:hypothetical protein dqs_1792 [Azoarcus olearius]|uniref:hypothetical protein n=1 Tax=Azoarcus sp. (strain BH72) TaxID=418699 RepID=UPI0008061A94|nr:hypothetical protein [Azoarcus olearius]ANQ84830.1 hypothetical protein dqs_1792 [Azoarcus olearius]
MAKDPTSRFSLDTQEAAARRDLREAKQAHREACLHLSQAPGDKERQYAVDTFEAEIGQHEKKLARIAAAREAATRQQTEQEHTDRLAGARDGQAAALALADQERKLVDEIVDLLENKLGSTLVRLHAVQQDRAQQATAALCAVISREERTQQLGRIERLTGTAWAANAITAAALASGLGRTPPLGPGVVVTAPFGGIATPEQSIERMSKLAAELDAYLAEAIERAANPTTANDEDDA